MISFIHFIKIFGVQNMHFWFTMLFQILKYHIALKLNNTCGVNMQAFDH